MHYADFIEGGEALILKSIQACGLHGPQRAMASVCFYVQATLLSDNKCVLEGFQMKQHPPGLKPLACLTSTP